MIETIARLGIHDASIAAVARDIIANTYAKSANQKGANAWKNEFYDDQGWWAMAWIASYDLTHDVKYLNTAKDLFEDMTGGWNTPCNGGIWWSKKRDYIAAIANELFLAVGASLANRVGPNEKDHYMNWAQMEWDWFWNSGLINKDGLINDGIDKNTCRNNNGEIFTYNQGVVLAGLSELARAKGDGGLIKHAYDIANAAMSRLTDRGILTEPGNSPLDETRSLFKGPFVRSLATLHLNEPQQSFKDFLRKNADSAWAQPKVNDGVIPDRWQGSSFGNTGSHAAGLDVLVAAARVS